MLVRSKLRASDVLQKELENHDKITVHLNTTVDEILGEDNKVTRITGSKDGEKVAFSADGVFVFIGLLPNTKFLQDHPVIKLDTTGFIKSNQYLQTAMPGVFVAGDVRSGATMQIATAVGEGATAALRIREYLEAQKRDGVLQTHYVAEQEH